MSTYDIACIKYFPETLRDYNKLTNIAVMVESLSRIYHRLRKEVNGQLVTEGLSMSKMKILRLITTGKTGATDIKNYMSFSSRTVVTVCIREVQRNFQYTLTLEKRAHITMLHYR